MISLFLIIFLSIPIKSYCAPSDIDIDFAANNYENTGTPAEFLLNSQNCSNPTDVYNATYSFTNDYRYSIYNWTDNSGSGCETGITETFMSHSKVLNLSDSSAVNTASIYTSFNGKIEGTFEFWFSTLDTSDDSRMNFLDGSTVGFRVGFRAGRLQYRNGASWADLVNPAQDNTWYHIRIDFDTVSDTYDIWVDGIFTISNAPFESTVAEIDFIVFDTHATAITDGAFIDALGYEWLSYSHWDGFFPYELLNNTLERANWTMGYTPSGQSTQIGDGNPPYWECTDIGAYSEISSYGLDNRSFHLDDGNTFDNAAFNYTNGFFEMTFDTYFYMKPTGSPSTNNHVNIKIYSFDSTQIIGIKLEGLKDGLKLYYYDGGWNQIGSTFHNDDRFLFTIKYNSDIALIESDSYFYNETTIFPLMASKEGLSNVEIIIGHDGLGNAGIELYIDNIGFKRDYVSIVDDFYVSKFEGISLDLRENFYFIYNLTGNYAINLESKDKSNVATLYEYREFTVYNRSYIIGTGSAEMSDGFLTIIHNTTSSINTNHLELEQIYMEIESDKIFPSLTFNNLQNNESYFYVSGTSLYYHMLCDDNNLEYLTATFDIVDINSENYTLFYYSDKNGLPDAYLSIDYSDGSDDDLLFMTQYGGNTFILDQDKLLDGFTITITDDDEFNNTVGTGLLTGMFLDYSAQISITTVAGDLISGLIILVPILFPAIVMVKKFGSIALFPMLLIMSIVLLAIEFIPPWLGITLIFCFGIATIYSLTRRS